MTTEPTTRLAPTLIALGLGAFAIGVDRLRPDGLIELMHEPFEAAIVKGASKRIARVFCLALALRSMNLLLTHAQLARAQRRCEGSGRHTE